MKKCLKRLCSMLIITSLVAGDITPVCAEKEINYKNEEDLVLDIVGTGDLNKDIDSDNENILIADGYEMCIEVPKDTSEPIYLTDGISDEVEMNLPQEVEQMDTELTERGTVLYTADNLDVSFDVEPLQVVGENEQTMEGLRTSIIIDNENAPREYEFSYDLSDGDRLVSSTEYLGEEFDTGEYYVVDSANVIKYIIDAPWAKDANGKDVNTYYRKEGNKLIQVVDFDKNTAFPVVADPSWWKIAVCVAAVSFVVGSAIFAAAKIKEIKKYIKALGGLKEACMLMMGATSLGEKAQELGKTLIKLGEILLGVDTVINNCPGIKSTMKKLKKKFK